MLRLWARPHMLVSRPGCEMSEGASRGNLRLCRPFSILPFTNSQKWILAKIFANRPRGGESHSLKSTLCEEIAPGPPSVRRVQSGGLRRGRVVPPRKLFDGASWSLCARPRDVGGAGGGSPSACSLRCNVPICGPFAVADSGSHIGLFPLWLISLFPHPLRGSHGGDGRSRVAPPALAGLATHHPIMTARHAASRLARLRRRRLIG